MTILYRQIADHYLAAIRAGTLASGDRFPSVRALMRNHDVSLSTALQACRHLEAQGWLEARARSGYYVRRPRRATMPPASELDSDARADPADYVGIHSRLSEILARGQRQPVRVNLALAVGAPQLYPAKLLQQLMQRQLRDQPQLLTTMTRRHGHPALRGALARRILARGVQAAPGDVLITHGCVEAVNLALRAVTQPGDTVAVESPTFYGVLQILESLGLRALEIPASPRTGLSLDALEFALQREREGTRATDGAPVPVGAPAAAGTPPRAASAIRAVITVPTLHNPMGSVMPDTNKARLVALCERYEIALIEDDIYADMGNGDTVYRPAKAWDRSGCVIYCNSLNKVLAPGLRLGWMLGGRWQARLEMLKYAQSRYGEEITQVLAAAALDSAEYDRHLARLRAALRSQREQMAETIADCFPAGTRLSEPEGGLLLWVELPDRISGDAVFEQALGEGIKIAPGSMFSNSRRFDHFVRLSCGWPHGPAIDGALRALGRIVSRAACATNPSPGSVRH